MTASPISASCPACGTQSLVPTDALLVSVAVGIGDSRSDEERSDALLRDAAAVAWTCPTCGDLAHATIGWPMLLTLATAGVELLDDGGTEVSNRYPERSAGGPPLTADDVLDLHALLDTDDWLDALQNGDPGRAATS